MDVTGIPVTFDDLAAVFEKYCNPDKTNVNRLKRLVGDETAQLILQKAAAGKPLDYKELAKGLGAAVASKAVIPFMTGQTLYATTKMTVKVWYGKLYQA
jgi:hypothetical protein